MEIKKINNTSFQINLANGVKKFTDTTYSSFGEVFLRRRDYHFPILKRILGANETFFMNKACVP